jgi:hypothetical protein
MWEAEDVGRLGIEWYYTGRQSLEENPYRAVSEPYMIIGLLAEKQFGRIRLFVNGENLTGVRQTRWDPLLLQTRVRWRSKSTCCRKMRCVSDQARGYCWNVGAEISRSKPECALWSPQPLPKSLLWEWRSNVYSL